MRTLIAAWACLAILGCGGFDESLASTAPSAATPALEIISPSAAELEAPLPMPAQEVIWQITRAREEITLDLVKAVVEERFFYPVDLSETPPEIPPPPCPNCR